MENTFGYQVGQWVATRRGKRGQITAISTDTVTVRFGCREFEMRNGQVVLSSAYSSMQAATATMASNQRYNTQ